MGPFRGKGRASASPPSPIMPRAVRTGREPRARAIQFGRRDPLSESKRDRVRAMFARVARGYDRLNSVLSMGLHHRWRRFAVRECEFPAGGRALDVAAGTGDFAIETVA